MDEEQWKDIPNYEGLYQASNFGRIKFLPKNKWNGKKFYRTSETISVGNICKNGYLYVGFIKKKFRVNRLVALTFIPNPENKKCVNHKDGNKLNNKATNLEWNTHSENTNHAFQNGLQNNHHFRKLTQENVDFIKTNKHMKQKELAVMFNIDQAQISRIINNHKDGGWHEKKTV